MRRKNWNIEKDMKNKFPRGTYRKNWDMEHESRDQYKRSRQKKEEKEIIEEEEGELEWFFGEESSETDEDKESEIL